jgi:hypothetical protein
MPFGEFDNAKKKSLFFIRSRWRGHAIQDMRLSGS